MSVFAFYPRALPHLVRDRGTSRHVTSCAQSVLLHCADRERPFWLTALLVLHQEVHGAHEGRPERSVRERARRRSAKDAMEKELTGGESDKAERNREGWVEVVQP